MVKASVILSWALCLILVLNPLVIFAKDYGVHGAVFEIEEQSMLELIYEKLEHMEKTGELAIHQQEMLEKSKETINRPAPVAGVTKAKTDREYYFDPSITLKSPVYGAKGELIHPAGRKVNPLDTKALDTTLIFIDGDDIEQQRFAFDYQQLTPFKKIILVKGNIMTLMKESGEKLYFDQGGVLVSKMGIKNVPAVVAQSGSLLSIREHAL